MMNNLFLSPLRYAFLGAGLLLLACNNKNSRPDVSGIKMDISIQRFDRDFFSMDTTHIDQSLKALYRKYPSFLGLYMEFLSPVNYIVQQGRSYTNATLEYLRYVRPLYDTAQAHYPDLDRQEKDLEKSLRYIKYYYP